MSLLDTVTSGKLDRPQIITLMGTSGIGKTTFAAGSPEPIFIQTEDGAGHLNVARFPVATSFIDVLEQIKTLGTEDHKYKTVVLDTIDHTELMCINELLEAHKVQAMALVAGGYGKGYDILAGMIARIVDSLIKLRDRKQMNVIMLCHTHVKHFDDPMSEGYDRYVPKTNAKVWAHVVEKSDAVGFAHYETKVITIGEGAEAKTVGRGQGKRVIEWEERPGWIAKGRAMPSQTPLNWSQMMEAKMQLDRTSPATQSPPPAKA
jgi:hypothetical protein